MALNGELIEVADLTLGDRSQMLALMERHYQNVSPKAFHADLDEKQWVIHVRDAQGELCGFSTQMVIEAIVRGQVVKALFSGDTIIDREHWGDHALMKLGGELALSLAAENWYWFLISQGYKTYRFLPVFFHEFYPRYDRPTPVEAHEVIEALATAKFGSQYDPASGVIRPTTSQYCLREGIAELTEERLRDPHIAHFAAKNPGHARGHELCCIAPLSPDNFTRAARRIVHLGSEFNV
jgi:hypothetical protein